MKRIVTLLSLIFAAVSLQAQTIGASYEVRPESPTTGFGARLELPLLKKIPVVSIRARAHVSFFSDESSLDLQNAQNNIPTDLSVWDAGLMGLVGVNIPAIPVSPYAGIGIGIESTSLEVGASANLGGLSPEIDAQNTTINGLVGLKLDIPLVKPFVEYRIAGVTGDKNDLNAPRRLQVGVSIGFK
jgi:opacity protein-like surface antigen